MKILALIVEEAGKPLCHAFDLESSLKTSWLPWIEKMQIKEQIKSIAHELLTEEATQGYHHSVIVSRQRAFRNYTVHTLQDQKRSVVLVFHEEYDAAYQKHWKVFNALFKKIAVSSELELANGSAYLEYLNRQLSDLQDGSKITEIKKDLAATQELMTDNLEKVMIRQEAIEDLVARTHQLEKDSDAFRKRSVKMNRLCCYLL